MPGHFTFFADSVKGNLATFSEQESKHAILVLRYSVGDSIEFTDGAGKYYHGKIVDALKRGMSAEIQSEVSVEPNTFTLGIGILKSSDRMEWIVEKCTEIGVGKIVFFKSQNSERAKINLEKLKKTAIAALKQSHGSWLPKIEESTFDLAIKMEVDQKYLAFCDEAMISNKPIPFEKNSAVFIGPEGDFTQAEVDYAKEHGVKVIGLGKQILRSETAALVCASWSIG
jgi:16S rRNA (uracil1498-N3)-methyltransferase